MQSIYFGKVKIKPWQYLTAGALVGFFLLSRKSRPSWNSPIEGYSPLESEEGCDPTEKPGVKAFRSYVLSHFGGTDMGILRDCNSGGVSGHKIGKSWDWGVAGGNVIGLLNFLFANDNEVIRRAGITYFIWNRHIWNTRNRTWQNYTGSNPHTDHIHFSLGQAGANGQTSFYRG